MGGAGGNSVWVWLFKILWWCPGAALGSLGDIPGWVDVVIFSDPGRDFAVLDMVCAEAAVEWRVCGLSGQH